ncbi:MAG: hypothetical protein AAGG68_25290, partial [Bacteroidota bacterium]
MPEALQIIEDRNIPDSLNFVELRRKGIEHIAELSGDLWTDHNVHDPGITMLEVLCYALTDLGYRTQFKIEELLARPDQDLRDSIPDNNFFTPAQILSCNPLTVLDYRKLLIDIDGVRNAWLEPATEAEIALYIDTEKSQLSFKQTATTKRKLQLNGLYHVCIELESIRPQEQIKNNVEGGDAASRILKEVNAKLHAHRNLGEDFLEVSVLQEQAIGLCADIELRAGADPDETLAKILEKVELFFSPRMNFYTLQEMLAKGHSMDEIFEGRPLTPDSHGFIEVKELEKRQRWTDIRVSDLYRVIMEVSGVKGIKNLTLRSTKESGATLIEDWCMTLKEMHYPVISLASSSIRFFKGVLPFEADKNKARLLFQKRLSNYQKVKLDKEQLDGSIPNGDYRTDLGEYYSIQHDFPTVYGIGEDGIPNSARPERKIQALQLKGYLLFYDQLLSDYLMQLANLRELFSFQTDESRSKQQNQTFFTGSLDSVPELDRLVRFHENTNAEFRDKQAFASLCEPTFNRPEERAAGVLEWIYAFETDKVVVSTIEMGGHYFFSYTNQLSGAELRSTVYYQEEAKAMQVAQSLMFLGTQKQAYRHINKQLEEIYTFDFIYQPSDYKTFSDEILESEQKYNRRRDQFLNHLLARFSEQFTDYVLLTFALEGKNNDPKKIIEDKASFLQAYPEISRNRGKAFDYTQEKIWNTDNVSGLEGRVTRLMGVHDWQRKSMGNFELVDRQGENYLYELYDKIACGSRTNQSCCEVAEDGDKTHHSSPLFRSLKTFTKKDEAQETFADEFLNLVKNRKNYRTFGNEMEQAYGFEIVDENGIPVIAHPRVYSSHQLREEAMHCVQEWLNDSPKAEENDEIVYGDDTGWIAQINSFAEGYYFSLRNEESKEIFKSKIGYTTEEQAWKAWLDFTTSAKQKENYQATLDIYGNHSFEIIGEEEESVAFHPHHYEDIDDCKAAQEKAYRYFTQQTLNYDLPQLPNSYHWQWKVEEVEMLKSEHAFKNKKQAISAFYLALQQGNFEDEKTADHKFYFSIQKAYEHPKDDGSLEMRKLTLATSKIFETTEERRVAKDKIKAFLKEVITEKNQAFQYELRNEENQVLLESKAYFVNRKFANWAAKQELPLACEAENLKIERADGCTWHVNLYNEANCLIAHTAIFKDFETAQQRCKEILKTVPEFEDYTNITATKRQGYSFHIQVDEIDLLSGMQIYEQADTALNAYYEAYSQAQNIDNYRGASLGQETLCLLEDTCGQALVINSDVSTQYISEKIRSQATPLQIETVGGQFGFQLLDQAGEEMLLNGAEDFSEEWESIRAYQQLMDSICTDEETIVKYKQEDACQFGFEVKQAEKTLATHPKLYDTEAERDEVVNQLLEYIYTHKLDYQLEATGGKFQYEIKWFNRAEVCESLFVGEERDSRKEVEEDLALLRSHIMDKACDDLFKETYDEINETFSFCIEIDGTSNKAHRPEGSTLFKNIEERNHVLDLVKDYFNAYKEHQNSQYFHPHILHNPCLIKDDCGDGDEEVAAYRSFRLKKNDFSIAKLVKKFDRRDKRNAAVQNMVLDRQQNALNFTKIRIDVYEKRIQNKLPKFHYDLVEEANNKVLWRSIAHFENEAAAESAAIKDNYFFTIIESARKAGNYRKVEQDGGFQLFLLNDKGEQIAEAMEAALASHEQCQTALRERLQYAKNYPIVKREGQWAFRLMDKKNLTTLWKSTATYSSFEAAWEGFYHFWNLLAYEGNYTSIDYPKACLFKIVLGEVLLEGKRIYEGKEENVLARSVTTTDQIELEKIKAELEAYQIYANTEQKLKLDIGTSSSTGKFWIILKSADEDIDLMKSGGEYESEEEARDDFVNFMYVLGYGHYNLQTVFGTPLLVLNENKTDIRPFASSINLQSIEDGERLEKVVKSFGKKDFLNIQAERADSSNLFQLVLRKQASFNNINVNRLVARSEQTYPNRQAAQAASDSFENILETKDLKKQELTDEESLYVFIDDEKTSSVNAAESYAWEEVGNFLEVIQRSGGIQNITYPQKGGAYSFQFVSKNYTQAIYPHHYYSNVQITRVRDWLFEKMNCTYDLFSVASRGTCTINKRLYHIIHEDCAGEAPLWRWKENQVIDPDESEEEKEIREIDGMLNVLHFAAFEGCYQFAPVYLGEDIYYSLQLLDDNAQVIAEAIHLSEAGRPTLLLLEEKEEDEIKKRVQHAEKYPYFKTAEGRYGFQFS